MNRKPNQKSNHNPAKRAGQVRVIGGQWRGRKLPVAEVDGLRPTSDRARETLFNWLQPMIPGARVLDLCAGTGVLGFEALSRGADQAVLVEMNSRASQELQQTAAMLGAEDRVEVVKADARNWLAQGRQQPFDLIFFDPPYASGLHQDLLDQVADQALLEDDGCLYVETDTSRPEIRLPAGWRVHRQKSIGQIRMQLLTVG